ncbi:MAG: SDR family NAD(P)-dependent oxidoreductase [Mariprofundaceae bacterium]|nr:SDR family NAD(P)-dependent oxidoreductase [Mariprofundaceae bacterium]
MSDKGAVLLTGATGGFGGEFARVLEQEGYRLLLHGRDHVRMQLTLDMLKNPKSHRVFIHELSARKGVEELLAGIADENLVGLVNNAGYGVWGGFEKKEGVAQIDVMRTDLIAPTTLSHALLPKLKRAQGFIINVSSLAGEAPLPYMSTYAAAKAGLTFWSEALRFELRGKVRVVTLAPGPSPTGFRRISGAPVGKGSFFSTPIPLIIATAIACLHQGGGYCVPGWRHRLLWLIIKLTPRSCLLAMMARYLK